MRRFIVPMAAFSLTLARAPGQPTGATAYCVFERFNSHTPYSEVQSRADWLRVARCNQQPGSPVDSFVLWPGQQPPGMTLAMAQSLADAVLVTDSGGFHRKCCSLYTPWKQSSTRQVGVVHNGVGGAGWQILDARRLCCEDAAMVADPGNPAPKDCRSFRLFAGGGSLVALTSKGVVSLTGLPIFVVPPLPYAPITIPAAAAGTTGMPEGPISQDDYCVFERFTAHSPYSEVASRADWLRVSRCRDNPGSPVDPFVLWPGKQPSGVTLAMAQALADDILVTDSGGFHRKCCSLYTSWKKTATGESGVVHNGAAGSGWTLADARRQCCEDAALSGDPDNPKPMDCRTFRLFAGGGALVTLTSKGVRSLSSAITITPPAPYAPTVVPALAAAPPVTQSGNPPKVRGYYVDMCLSYPPDKSKCGDPAADAYCRMTGHPNGSSNAAIGKVQSTISLGDQQIHSSGWENGFTSIDCRP